MTANENAALRHALFECLYARRPLALALRGIRRRAADEVDFTVTDEDAERELELLRGLGLVEKQQDPFGPAVHWKITAAGVLQFERKE